MNDAPPLLTPLVPAEEIRALEKRAFAAWPALEVADVDGWRLRFMAGVTRRANSVWPQHTEGRISLDERIAVAERFYAERGQPAVFQVLPEVSAPPDLDAALAARGYRVDAPVAVKVAAIRDVLERPAGPHAVDVAAIPGEPWLEISARRGRFKAVEATYRGLLDRLAGRALFALASTDGGEAAAVGMGVVDGEWLGVFSMVTLAERRRQGFASAVLRALVTAGAERGAGRLYLQVERDNEPARALYRGLGLRAAYGYHYRIAPPRS